MPAPGDAGCALGAALYADRVYLDNPDRDVPDHPFWGNPHVTITPHVCGPLVPEDVVPHFLANYAAFASGQPLRNVIDLERQY